MSECRFCTEIKSLRRTARELRAQRHLSAALELEHRADQLETERDRRDGTDLADWELTLVADDA